MSRKIIVYGKNLEGRINSTDKLASVIKLMKIDSSDTITQEVGNQEKSMFAQRGSGPEHNN